MSLTLAILLTVLLAATVAALMLYRKAKKGALADPEPGEINELPDRSAHPETKAQARPEPADEAAEGSFTYSPGLNKELRLYLTRGVERLFDAAAATPEAWAKPRLRENSDPKTLKDALTRLASLHQFRDSQMRLQKLLLDPAVQMAELSKIITSDPLMTAKILKMANSSYFGVQQRIDSIGHALMILGLQNVKNILYREGVRMLFEDAAKRNKEATSALWRHANLACVCASHFSDLFDGLNRGTLFTLGIVHDIGKLILMDIARDGKKGAGNDEYPMDILIGEEDRLFGINHAVIGGCAMENWNFSELMTQVVLYHHAPAYEETENCPFSRETLHYILTLFLADQTAKLFTGWNEGAPQLYSLRESFMRLVDRKKFLSKILDANFLAQIRAAEAISIEEH